MMVIQPLFTTVIQKPNQGATGIGLYIDAGPLFCLLFCGSKKVRNRII
jgi:hypothetical protein